jgi:glutamate synthase (NADPH/NADH) small chain
MPEPQKNRPDYMPWPEYPNILRSSTSHEEGCIRKWSISTKKFIGKNNNINKIECSELEWKFDDKGKPLTFKEKKLSNFFIDCDLVLIAAGFTGTGNNSLIEKNNIKLNEHNFVYVKDYNTNIKNIFCCGDMAEGPSLVVKALESGKRTALKVASVVS